MKLCDRCRVSGCCLNYLGEACKRARKRECPDVVFTNADRIRAMSDEELSQNINRLLEGEISIPYCRELPECDAEVERDAPIPVERCEQCVLKWLRQPAEEEWST